MSTLLIIENNYDLREILKIALECESYHVLTACDGQVGMEILRSTPNITLIVLDLGMPVCDGFEFLELRAREGFGSVPVCVISATIPIKKPKNVIKFIHKPVLITQLTDLAEMFALPVAPVTPAAAA